MSKSMLVMYKTVVVLVSFATVATTAFLQPRCLVTTTRIPRNNNNNNNCQHDGKIQEQQSRTVLSSPAAAAAANSSSATAAAAVVEATTTEGGEGGGSRMMMIESNIAQLKRVLSREYASFFDPMEREYYAEQVTFDDPMTSLTGVDRYQNNVDMLASRTIMGSILFQDAGIVLHSVQGGNVSTAGDSSSIEISDIVTRWTLRVRVQILPWQPVARFTGVSVYKVRTGGPKGVQVTKQTDYWDSINLQKGGTYDTVNKGIAVRDFLNQLQPDEFNAAQAGPELPYELLRRARGYEVRRYPSFVAVQCPYQRRDEGFGVLGSFTSGMTPLAPALMVVPSEKAEKTMMWPLAFAPPGEAPPNPSAIQLERAKENANCELVTVPSRVVAVGSFADASVEPVVRRASKALRKACERDDLTVVSSDQSLLRFAQYDAVFSLGKRRGEVWIDLLDGGHPW